ncbi:MAG: hypothetical protein OEZ68_04890 [Gammaproteobacteria bacterium]|nr:hypothetical protein [Gammaproteobacteria bacterium]MDH5800124.1 hypothetical protein [Gammaproteobacteria bacterium]
MPAYRIKQNLYLYPTPAGTFYTISADTDDPERQLLQTLFQLKSSPKVDLELLANICGLGNRKDMVELLHHMQTLGWLQGCSAARRVYSGPLEQVLPQMLGMLSGDKKALLADQEGFYISQCGFDQEQAEYLAALSADLSGLQKKYSDFLSSGLALNYDAWAIPDAFGNSQLGFWSLYIGGQRFVLLVQGVPRFNAPVLTEFVWALTHRYGEA